MSPEVPCGHSSHFGKVEKYSRPHTTVRTADATSLNGQYAQSSPSLRRTVTACVLYAMGGLAAILWKLMRNHVEFTSDPISAWLLGTMPNFLPALVMPMLVFIRPQVVRTGDYLQMVMIIFIVLCAYEFMQIWIPRRTFDWDDIIATAAGTGIGCLVGWTVFFVWLGYAKAPEQTSS